MRKGMILCCLLFLTGCLTACIVDPSAQFASPENSKETPNTESVDGFDETEEDMTRNDVLNENLLGDWIQIGIHEYETPERLTVTNSEVILTWGKEDHVDRASYDYSPSSQFLFLEKSVGNWYDTFYFHEEQLIDGPLKVLSVLIEELDGRGYVPISEFVPLQDKDRIKCDFISDFAREILNSDPSPTNIE